MQSPFRTILFALTTLLASALLAIFLGEVYLRFMMPQFSRLGFQYLQLDESDIRYRNARSCKFQLRNGGFDADFFTNAQGFRDHEDNLAGLSDKKVVFVGDSYTYGYGVKEQEVFTTILNGDPDFRGMKLRAINGGVTGYGMDQLFLKSREMVSTFSPSLIVINGFVDDPVDNMFRSIYFLDKGELRKNPPLRLSWIGELKIKLEQSHLFLLLKSQVDGFVSQRARSGALDPRIGILFAHTRTLINHIYDWPFYSNSDQLQRFPWKPNPSFAAFYEKEFGEPFWQYAWALQAQLVRETVSMLHSERIPLVFVLFPHVDQIRGTDSVYDVYQTEMRKLLKELGVAVVDLRNIATWGPENHFEHDSHFNVVGNRVLAEIMKTIVRAHLDGRQIGDGLFSSTAHESERRPKMSRSDVNRWTT